MRYSKLLAILGLLLIAQPSRAEESPKPEKSKVVVSGFGLSIYNSQTDRLFPTHLWLVVNAKELQPKLDLLAILAPVGPPDLIHHLQLKWRQPTDLIDSISVGKMNPPFGYEFQSYRIDRVPGGFYSAINNRLSTKDTGLTISGHEGRLKVIGGLFLGHRLGSNVPQAERGSLDVYLRSEYKIGDGFLIGASQRMGPVPATGLDVSYDRDHWRLAYEAVYSTNRTESFLLGLYRLNKRANIFGRHEWLKNQQTSVGLDLTHRHDDSFRLVRIMPNHKPGRWAVEYVVRF